MKVHYAVTFEFDTRPPMAHKGTVAAAHVSTCVRRAVQDAQKPLRPIGWSSLAMSEFDRGRRRTLTASPHGRSRPAAAASASCCNSPAFSLFGVSRNSFVAPATAKDRVSVLPRSPVTHVMPQSSCRWFGLRINARAGVPARDSRRMTSMPIAPVLRVTKIMVRPGRTERLDSAPSARYSVALRLHSETVGSENGHATRYLAQNSAIPVPRSCTPIGPMFDHTAGSWRPR
jgi:hypothetical protein